MTLNYVTGEEIKCGDIILYLTIEGGFYKFRNPIMKVWNVVKTNDGEVMGVALVDISTESPTILMRRLVREGEKNSEQYTYIKDMPGFFMTTRHLVPIDQIYRCLGLIARIDFLSESTTNHIELIQDEIHKKSLRLKGIFQYFQAEKAYGNRDFSKHIDLLRSTAESGYTPAMCHFAGLFFNGDLIQKNLEGYFYWYREAANQNDALAIYQLAGCYARGTGIEQDLNIGLSLLKESASKGCWAAVFGWASYFRFG